MNIKSLIQLIIIVSLSFNLQGCKMEQIERLKASTPKQYRPKFVSITPVSEITAKDLQTAALLFGANDFASKIQYDIVSYKVVYKTNYKGDSINASGVLYIPKGMEGPAPIVSAQHGTTFRKNDAPTVSNSVTGMEFFAGGGYITFVPDFIGYGSSADIFHPYYDQKHSAYAVIDFIKAGKEYFDKNNIKYNDKLFLLGYSEGGYVTLATQKEIETNLEHNLKATAVAAGAGGYDLLGMLKGIKDNNYFSYPAYLAFLLQSYNTVNSWSLPYDHFYNKKYADKMPSLLDGTKSGSEINNQITTNLDSLFNTEFYNRIKGSGEYNLKSALASNSINNWKTIAPLKLYHGTKDEVIPILNSEETFQKLKALGASNIELIPIQGGNHGSSMLPMIRNVIPWFESFKNE